MFNLSFLALPFRLGAFVHTRFAMLFVFLLDLGFNLRGLTLCKDAVGETGAVGALLHGGQRSPHSIAGTLYSPIQYLEGTLNPLVSRSVTLLHSVALPRQESVYTYYISPGRWCPQGKSE